MERPPLFSINMRTFLHGLFMAIGGACAGIAQQWIETGNFPTSYIDLIPAAKVAGGAALVYISKEIASNSNGELLKKEPK